jgi:hypothetical protein
MADPEYSATGVQIGKRLRHLTRAGQVVISNGRLVLRTSRGAEIDSAPVDRVEVSAPWYGGRRSARATINGTRYLIAMDQSAPASSAAQGGRDAQPRSLGRFLDAMRNAKERGSGGKGGGGNRRTV